MPIQYKMKAYKTSIPTGLVYWTSYDFPDMIAKFSGHSLGELINISINSVINTQNSYNEGHSYSNILSGGNDIITDGYNVVSGTRNQIVLTSDPGGLNSKYNLVTGDFNYLDVSSYNIIDGYNNSCQYEGDIVSGSDYNFISGTNNQVLGTKFAFINGNNNTVIESDSSLSLGSNNTFNYVSWSSAIIGNHNTASHSNTLMLGDYGKSRTSNQIILGSNTGSSGTTQSTITSSYAESSSSGGAIAFNINIDMSSSYKIINYNFDFLISDLATPTNCAHYIYDVLVSYVGTTSTIISVNTTLNQSNGEGSNWIVTFAASGNYLTVSIPAYGSLNRGCIVKYNTNELYCSNHS